MSRQTFKLDGTFLWGHVGLLSVASGPSGRPHTGQLCQANDSAGFSVVHGFILSGGRSRGISCTLDSPQVSRVTKVPKYTYVRLDDLKPGTVVNVYGVVVFFKQPFRSRGTGQSRMRTTLDELQVLRPA